MTIISKSIIKPPLGLVSYVITLSESYATLNHRYNTNRLHGVTVSDTYRVKKLTVGYSIRDEISTTCFQLCELV